MKTATPNEIDRLVWRGCCGRMLLSYSRLLIPVELWLRVRRCSLHLLTRLHTLLWLLRSGAFKVLLHPAYVLIRPGPGVT